jgi:hypothetical protein
MSDRSRAPTDDFLPQTMRRTASHHSTSRCISVKTLLR